VVAPPPAPPQAPPSVDVTSSPSTPFQQNSTAPQRGVGQ
jgi:hypothetical protein